MRANLVDLTVHRHATSSGGGILVSLDGDSDEAVWLPASQLEISETGKPGVLDITMPRQLAQEKGLI